MKPYPTELLSHLAEGAFREGIVVRIDIAKRLLPREVAETIALFANEALTNCIKYAFPHRRTGRVDISFEANGSGALTVVDDGMATGCRKPMETQRPARLGATPRRRTRKRIWAQG